METKCPKFFYYQPVAERYIWNEQLQKYCHEDVSKEEKENYLLVVEDIPVHQLTKI